MISLPPGATRDAGAAAGGDAGSGRSTFARIIVTCSALLAIAAFIALGIWQVQRRAWKLDLIATTEQRVHAPPVQAPPPAAWAAITAEKDAYRHVAATGIYLPDRSVRVQAVTELGAGFWLLTPLRQPDGTIVLINRGFVLDRQSHATAVNTACGNEAIIARSPTTVTGLLRISEPHGAFLRDNVPSAQRWYSRDVAAIAQQQQLAPVAPYFIDADADPTQTPRVPSSDCPIGGLTVVHFHNSHLVYAITWFALALMVAGAFGWNSFAQRRDVEMVNDET